MAPVHSATPGRLLMATIYNPSTDPIGYASVTALVICVLAVLLQFIPFPDGARRRIAASAPCALLLAAWTSPAWLIGFRYWDWDLQQHCAVVVFLAFAYACAIALVRKNKGEMRALGAIVLCLTALTLSVLAYRYFYPSRHKIDHDLYHSLQAFWQVILAVWIIIPAVVVVWHVLTRRRSGDKDIA